MLWHGEEGRPGVQHRILVRINFPGLILCVLEERQGSILESFRNGAANIYRC